MKNSMKKSKSLPRKVSVKLDLPEGVTPEMVQGLRPEVLTFALMMERELRANSHKGDGWKTAPAHLLLAHACEEMAELIETMTTPITQARQDFAISAHHLQCARVMLERFGPHLTVTPSHEMGAEGADLGNLVWMVLARLGVLVPPKSLGPAGSESDPEVTSTVQRGSSTRFQQETDRPSAQ